MISRAPNGLEISRSTPVGSRPASQGRFRAEPNTRVAGAVEDPRPLQGAFAKRSGGGSIELLAPLFCEHLPKSAEDLALGRGGEPTEFAD